MVEGKKFTKDGKKSKDELDGTQRDRWLEAIRELTNIVNEQNKMIRKQNVKLQELVRKLGEKN